MMEKPEKFVSKMDADDSNDARKGRRKNSIDYSTYEDEVEKRKQKRKIYDNRYRKKNPHKSDLAKQANKDYCKRWRDKQRMLNLLSTDQTVVQKSVPLEIACQSTSDVPYVPPTNSLPKPNSGSNSINIVVTKNIKKNIPSPSPKTDAKSINYALTKNITKNISTPKLKTGMEATHKVVAENINKKISSPKPKTDTKCIAKTVAFKAKEKIDSIKKNTTGCKRCAFLQCVNKNKKYLPKACKVCLKWSHKVLEDGDEAVPNINISINNTTTPTSAITPTGEQDLNTNIVSTIKVEIETVTDFNMIQEGVTEIDPPKPSIEIEPLDASMSDEIMSDVIKEEKTEIDKTESVDFDEVILIQDRLNGINDKNTALAHVRILQEYAMLNDNYRAIGLLSEVEAALINPAKTKDFEC